MAQNYSYPSSSQVTISGIGNPTGQAVPSDAVYVAGEDPSGNLHGLQTDANGALITTPAAGSQTHVIVDSSALPTGAATSANQTSEITLLTARLAGSLVPAAYNEVDLTYVASGNGAGQIQTATYKLAGTTVKTLTLTYDASNRISTVVAS